MLERILRICFRKCALMLAIIIIAWAAILNLARMFSFLVEDNKELVKYFASHVFHQSMTVKHLSLKWVGADPFIDLRDVTILTKSEPIVIQHIAFSVNLLKSIFHRHLLPDHLFIEGGHLILKEDKNQLNNLLATKTGRDEHEQQEILWLSSVKEFFYWLVTQSNIVIHNISIELQFNNGKKVVLQKLKFQVRNNYLYHDMMGTAIIEPHKMIRFVVIPTDLQQGPEKYGANFYIRLPKMQYQNWWDFKKFPLSVLSAEVSAKIWGVVQLGKLAAIQAKINAYHVQVLSRGFHQSQTIPQLSAQLDWQANSLGWKLFVDHLKFYLTQRKLNFNQLMFRHKGLKYWFYCPKQAISSLKDFARLIMEKNQLLLNLDKYLNLSGKLSNISLFWEYEKNHTNFLGKAHFNRVSFRSHKKWPGFSYLTGDLQISPNKMEVTVNSPRVVLELPYLFNKNIQLYQFKSEISWKKNLTNQWQLEVPYLGFHDGNLFFLGQLNFNQKSKLLLTNFNGTFKIKDVAQLSNLVPHHFIPGDLQTWLKEAFHRGTVDSGVVHLMQSVKCNKPHSHFYLAMNVNNLDLKYSPDWPLLQNAKGFLIIDNNRLSIAGEQSQTVNNFLKKIQVKIPNLDNPIIQIRGQAHGDVASAVNFLQQSPLRINSITNNLSGQGKLDLDLKIRQSLVDLDEPADVVGDLHLLYDDLQFTSFPKLSHVSGTVHFHNFIVQAQDLAANILGQNSRILLTTEVNPQHQPITLFHLSGKLSPGELLNAYSIPNLANFKGVIDYQALLKIKFDNNRIFADFAAMSDLAGLSIDLPTYYHKTIEQRNFSSLRVLFSDNLKWKFNYAKHLFIFASLLRGENWKFHIRSNRIQGDINISSKNSDALTAYFSRLDFSLKDRFKRMLKAWSDSASFHKFSSIDLFCESCFYNGKNLGLVKLQAHHIPRGMVLDACSIKNKSYSLAIKGKWACTKKNKVNDQQFCKTKIYGDITHQQLGDFLRDWKMTRVVNEGYGTTRFILEWPGLPYQADLAHMNGDLAFNYVHGRIVRLSDSTESKLGLGRLLNLLSMQSLPQNLITGFTHLGKKGFEFANLKGTLSIKNGCGYSNNIELAGPLAWANIKGNVNFAKNSCNLHLGVTPNMTASLPVIVGIAGGPLAGVVTWLVNQIVAPKIGAVVRSEYYIKGSMEKPIITEVKN